MTDSLRIIRNRFEDIVFDGFWSENIHQMMKNHPVTESVYDEIIDGEIPGTKCWGDIDYADENRSAWDCVRHLARMFYILRDCGKKRLIEDASYADNMIALFEHWLKRNPRNPNWWYNAIGTPRCIADITLMLYPVLNADQIRRACEIIEWGSLAKEAEAINKETGANLVWCMSTTVKHAILTENAELLTSALRRTEEELVIAREGIQEDGSFFQHGRRLYSGGYGRSFAYEMAQLIYALNGTEYAINEKKCDFFLTHILDGLRYMTCGNALDCASVGREINRISGLRPGILKMALELLTKVDGINRRDELCSYLGEMNGTSEFIGTKYFPQPKMLCHHIPGLYVGVKNLDGETFDAEICNSEGLLMFNMSYGTHCCIMRSGEEHADLLPVFDCARIPGTTSRYETDSQLESHDRKWNCLPLPAAPDKGYALSGGLRSGGRAAMYELAQHDGVTALVSCFACEDGVIFLGTDIRCTERPETLFTTLDQCRLFGKAELHGDTVIHNGIRYTRLEGPELKTESETRIGSWRRHNSALSDARVVDSTFTVWMEHPAGETGHYAYAVTPSDVIPDVTVIRNDTSEQSVRLGDGSVMSVRYDDEVTVEL